MFCAVPWRLSPFARLARHSLSLCHDVLVKALRSVGTATFLFGCITEHCMFSFSLVLPISAISDTLWTEEHRTGHHVFSLSTWTPSPHAADNSIPPSYTQEMLYIRRDGRWKSLCLAGSERREQERRGRCRRKRRRRGTTLRRSAGRRILY
ncbi:hypothetical protein EXIGLDRAFT_88864 [Exidia glandulosa HHB12029]|uniref:Uncharacterized protein n=1 Tax=Exidia glandulosa HHB12029 TaxID=1314781 RepID=A0A166BHY0_EXIGL|nr:hypothetical protein EXIGLDRAFT_88864 [Exidia glandulosa HHB12029]